MDTKRVETDRLEREATCEKHGAYAERGMVLFGKATWFGCQECQKEIDLAEQRSKTEAAERQRQERIEARLNFAGIPVRFRERTLDNYAADEAGQQEALKTAHDFVADWPLHRKKGTCVVFSGNPGTGKSHLAIAMLQIIMQSGTGMYINVLDLVRMVRDTWRKTSQSETDVLNTFAGLDLLVIDEVGVQYGTDGEQVILFDVLNRRYLDCKPTILLTNLRAKEFQDFVGARAFDRMKENGIWQRFTWESHRGKK